MRHPFANPQYSQTSLSTDSINWLRRDHEAPQSDVPPVPPLSSANELGSARPLPHPRSAFPPITTEVRRVDSRASSSMVSPGHYVMHSNKITLLLSGQEEGVQVPIYTPGSTIDGIIAVPRPAGLLSLEVKVAGTMSLDEAAGSGFFESEIINETLFRWDGQQQASFPPKISFRYCLPTHYTDLVSGERCRLPPTYRAHLDGIPGFSVHITYGIMVSLTRLRDRAGWWRKASRIWVPFHCRDLTCPPRPGPFPLNLMRHPSCPKTLFVFTLQARRKCLQDMEVHLYLPASQTCTLREPIPFFVTVFGDEESLEPFAHYQPSPASFLPLATTQPSFSSSLHVSLHKPFHPRTTQNSSPIRVQLQRRTAVDAGAAALLFGEKRHISALETVGQGVIFSSTRTANSVKWSGVIEIPSYISTGGFAGSGLNVNDLLLLSIFPPGSARSRFMTLSESVPLRLTTETYDCHSATVIQSDWT